MNTKFIRVQAWTFDVLFKGPNCIHTRLGVEEYQVIGYLHSVYGSCNWQRNSLRSTVVKIKVRRANIVDLKPNQDHTQWQPENTTKTASSDSLV
jgi:hypothetical protein